MTPRDPYRYLNPAMIAQRQRAMAWIAKHRILRRTSWALAKLEHTPAAIEQAWRNGSIPTAILQTAAAITIGLGFAGMYGLYF